MVGLHVSCSGTSLQVPVSTLLGDVVASAKANHPHTVQLHLRVPDVKVLDPDKAIGTAAYVTFGRKAALEAWHATQTCSGGEDAGLYVPSIQLVAIPSANNGGIGCVPVPVA